jgi:endoglucanase Acf2
MIPIITKACPRGRLCLISMLLACSVTFLQAQTVVPVGSGSYTTTFPGTDAGGRNAYPSGSPQITGNAAGKPVPTNDWWSKLIKENHADNLFNHIHTMKTLSTGLIVSYIARGVIDDLAPITVGVTGLSASKVTVSDYTDWTVTMNWNDNTHLFEATAGLGMPFIYFTKGSSDVAQITVASTTATVTIQNEMLIIANAKNGASFAAYAPAGSTWTNSSGVYTSNLNGKNYWSICMLPVPSTTTANAAARAAEYKQFAYTFPANTTVQWNYTPATGTVRTDFSVTPEVKEGSNNTVLMGLLPHHWAHLASNSAQPTGYVYQRVRGEIKMMNSNTFSVENKYSGILPTLPYVANSSPGYSTATMSTKLTAMQADQIGDWTDSYNDGQLLNRLVQSARVAAETENTVAFNTMFATIKNRVENWLKYDPGEVAFMYYYNSTWTALLGYPAGHGQDSNLNDHHFHWGYMIHAAAFIEQYQPGWAAQWGGMVDLLVRDAACPERTDNLFPFLRNFNPYSGHSWANGFATFPQGQDQESTSESMLFNSAIIHWGTITGNTQIRDLGVYLYSTEQTAIEEYWFDMNDRVFPDSQQYSVVSRVWGNDFDNGTFWTTDIAASYGIELYPIHGGSLYLGHNAEYAAKLWAEIKQNTGIVQNQVNDNLWHDVMWEYAAFTNPGEAVAMYNSYPNRSLKFGISDAQTYYWLHAMNCLGRVDASVTANSPVAAVFNNYGLKTYVVQNYGSTAINVTFSDGYVLNAPARKLTFAREGVSAPAVTLTSPQNNAKFPPNQSIKLSAEAIDFDGDVIQQVAFYQNGNLIDTDTDEPYEINWTPPAEGTYAIQAKATNVQNETGESTIANILISAGGACVEESTEASQGSFGAAGYRLTYETSGTALEVTAELLDNKDGVVAYFWNVNPFQETMMTGAGNRKFTISVHGLELGATISFAVKFAWAAGGLGVTKNIDYEVGSTCINAELAPEAEAPAWEVFPNPAGRQVSANLPAWCRTVRITDLNGRTVAEYAVQANAARPCVLPLQGFAAGVYALQAVGEGRSAQVKLIVTGQP